MIIFHLLNRDKKKHFSNDFLFNGHIEQIFLFKSTSQLPPYEKSQKKEEILDHFGLNLVQTVHNVH